MSKHERFTTAVNDSTGDLIKTKASGQDKYAQGWEAIFGKKEDMLEQITVVEEEEPTVSAFVEELLPSGIIGDEV